jgi:hypothetical protein
MDKWKKEWYVIAHYCILSNRKKKEKEPSKRNNTPAGGHGKHGDARLCAWAAYTDGERGVLTRGERRLPIVHIKEERGGGLVQMAVRQ